MGSDGHRYKTDLMRYLKYEWDEKNRYKLPYSDKWNIVGAVDGVLQHKNDFDCGLYECMYA